MKYYIAIFVAGLSGAFIVLSILVNSGNQEIAPLPKPHPNSSLFEPKTDLKIPHNVVNQEQSRIDEINSLMDQVHLDADKALERINNLNNEDLNNDYVIESEIVTPTHKPLKQEYSQGEIKNCKTNVSEIYNNRIEEWENYIQSSGIKNSYTYGELNKLHNDKELAFKECE